MRTMNNSLKNSQKELHALHGLVAEVGEIHSIYQKKYQGHPMKLPDLVNEMGDLLWFLAELATVLGVSLDAIAAENIDKLRNRYPDGFDEERSVNRDENEQK